ncbi:unnamed protein product, partial [Staurois parvus]
MTLGRKGLTCGAIKGLPVCCFTLCAVCVLLGKHAALYCSAVYTQTSPLSLFLSDRWVPVENLQPGSG